MEESILKNKRVKVFNSVRIRPRPNAENPQYYSVVVSWKDDISKERTQTSIRCDTLREAEKVKLKLQLENFEEKSTKMSDVTLEEYTRYYLEHCEKLRCSDATLRSYEGDAELYIIPILGKYKLKEIKPAYIQNFILDLSDKGLAVSSIKHVMRLVRAILNNAYNMGYLEKRKITEIKYKYPKEPQKEKKDMIYTVEECKELLKQSEHDEEMHLFFLLAFDCLLRRAEFCGLRWQDIDFEKGIVHIKHSIVCGRKEKSVMKTPKTQSSVRDIQVMQETLRALKHQHAKYKEMKLKYGEEFYDGDFVFFVQRGNIGDPYKPASIYNKYRRFLINNKWEKKLKLHCLRHSGISMLIRLGLNPLEVQHRAGHASLSMTLDTYSHFDDTIQESPTVLQNTLFDNKKVSSF